MKIKKNIVGAFNAKTHLSQLLEEVKNGSEITITKRGKPIARLIPYQKNNKVKNMNVLLEGFDAIRKSVKGKVNIKTYIAEGRKY